MPHRSVISIDIGSYKTKIAVGHLDKGCIYLEQAFTLDTIEGSVSDGKLISAEGKIDSLRTAIVQALNEHKIKYKNVILTLQSTSVIRRELEVPKAKPNEMESMIRYEIEQYLPIDLNEYIIEYKVLEERLDDKSKILTAAMPKEIAEDYLHLLNAMNHEPRALDINSNAVTKLFGYEQRINNNLYGLDKTAAFIDMGCNNIGVTILSKGVFQFSRLIPTGGKELTEGIANAFSISLYEAEKKKLKEADLQNSDLSEESALLNQVIKNIVTGWAEEIQKVFQFYKTRNANNDINEIYLFGGTSNLRGIEEFLTNSLSLPATPIKSVSSIVRGKSVESEDLEYYLNAIGAIIRK